MKYNKVKEWLSKNITAMMEYGNKTTKWGLWLKMKIPSLPNGARPKDALIFKERNRRFRRCINTIQRATEKRYKLKASDPALKHLSEAGTKSYVQSLKFELFASAKEKGKVDGLPEESLAFEIENEIEEFIKKAGQEMRANKVPTKENIRYKKSANRLDPGYKKKLFMEEDD